MKYFAYGSNMNPERMRKRGVNFLDRKCAVLEGWRLMFNKKPSRPTHPQEGYANIERDENSVVEGVLYTIKDEDIEQLDRYEGYPNHYDRIKVKVKLRNGEEVEAITYVARPDKVEEGLKPARGYLGHLLKGKDCLSKEYYEMLENWETVD